MGRRSPLEVTTRYATTVDTLSDAWEFVMDHLDRVSDAPSVEISPTWSSDDDFRTPYFSVVVSGMVQDPPSSRPGAPA